MALGLSTEGLARTSARHPWPVIGAWLLILAASIAAIGLLLGDALTSEVALTNNPESQQADDLIEERVRGPEHADEIVIVQSADKTVDDPEFRQAVEGLYARISGLGSEIVAGGTNFYESGDVSLVSEDGRTTIMPFVLAGDEEDAEIGPILAAVEEADGENGFSVLISGDASINEDFEKVAEEDLQTGETIGVPIALIVLLLVFGAVVAAFVPLVLGIFAIVVAVGLTAVLGQGFEFSLFVTNVIGMMGLAVGIDYSLFIVSRYREERQKGLDKVEAVAAAGATSSRAVFFSGMTVVLALLGMLLVPSTIFRSLGAGAIIVVIISVAISLTLLPAILGLLGDKVNALKMPFIGKRSVEQDHETPGGFWDTVTRFVMRYPVLSLLAAAGLMLALAVSYVDLNTGSAGVSTLPDDVRARQGFEVLEGEFSFGLVMPTEVAVDGDIDSPAVRDAIDEVSAAVARDPIFGEPELEVNEAGDAAVLSIPVNGDPTGEETVSAVRELRDDIVPAAFEGTGASAYVGGATSGNIDYFDTTNDYTPVVFVFVLGLSFVLLTIVFRSLVVPVKAIIMNLLSVGASYGALVLVFQKGVGNEIFGFQQVDIIEAWVPLWTFSILFGLSMDYHVFLLSRIRERFDQSGDNKESVAFGVRSTAGLITGAALIMVAVFGGVASGQLVMFQQMGFGLAVAVLLDATIVRSVLVPAAMQLLGKANWWLPSALSWLPQVQTDGAQRVRERAAGGAEAS